ncbi:MATE family efflux transporter [Halomonas sp. MCCC 1A17488]|uniref:MATE family efflux transporter n=1 Tax=unclassified Halomonas TaxID=2609666 RepID=UPI0018D24A0D|nr:MULTISPECIES: MATE family efflux transporter [unclassified Halomonas]MCE8014469.1 MATE family efflux transporter [Halomonas sp. MCCC 1A17488]MCG3237802.1 MATE family efflux transporter [Halomonas sp. MCCC 1A17488]QPP48402.1 MATE family efflux transporter [Halomonas sp. SS10-MC5]
MATFFTDLLSVSRTETRPLLRLTLPICGAQLAQAGMSVTDVMMTGRVSATDLAAVSVGSSLWLPLMLFMTGTLMGLTPIVAHLLGGGATKHIRPNVHQALWLALALGLSSAALLWLLVAPIFRLLEVPPEVAHRSSAYLAAVAFGMPGVALFQALRAFSDGMNHTRPSLWISLVGLGVNIPSNFVLIYGGDGLTGLFGSWLPTWLQELPALGALGCGIATALSMWTMCLAMAAYTRRSRAYGDVSLWHSPTLPRWRLIGELLYVGVPIGVAIFVEVTLFTLISLFIASLGEVTVAAHQVALNYTSILFMLPLALSMALTVRVGNTLGQGKPMQARMVAWNGVLVSVLIALFNSALLWFTAEPVMALYTHDTAVQRLALSLILLAMLYQISDSLQVNLAGALRGYKDTRVIMLITLLAYWAVGLGGGHWLGTRGLPGGSGPLGVHGYWIGLIAGLTVAAALLGARLRCKAKGVANGKLDIARD